MNRRIKGISIVFVLIFSFSVYTDIFAQVEFHGFVRNHSVFRIDKPNDAMLLRNRLRLNPELYGDNIYGFASLDILNDPAGENKTLMDLREAYLDIYSSFVDLAGGLGESRWLFH